VTFGRPDGIGMSSVVGLLAPLDRETPEGRRVQLVPVGETENLLSAPIAPGLIEDIGIGVVEIMKPNQLHQPSVSEGSFALDGERELTFSETDDVSIRLQIDAFRTINVLDCMTYSAKHGLLTSKANNRLARLIKNGRTS
jgi:hypothetical protein